MALNCFHWQKGLKCREKFVMACFIWIHNVILRIVISKSGLLWNWPPQITSFKHFQAINFKTSFSNILLNVYKDINGKFKWKSGDENPKSVVITDFGISSFFLSIDQQESAGTAGWAPPEQWIGKFYVPWVFSLPRFNVKENLKCFKTKFW